MNLYISRHGETIFNTQKRITGSTDSPLTPKGIEQAEMLGKSLDGIIFDMVYCSPLGRAVQTISAAFGDNVVPCVDRRLAEINLGVMEGLTFSEADEKYPRSGMLFFTNPVLYETPPGGEGLNGIINRIASFIDDVIKSGFENVFILTHGYAMRVIHACTVGNKSIPAIAEAPSFTNCSLVKYTYNKEKWELKQDY